MKYKVFFSVLFISVFGFATFSFFYKSQATHKAQLETIDSLSQVLRDSPVDTIKIKLNKVLEKTAQEDSMPLFRFFIISTCFVLGLFFIGIIETKNPKEFDMGLIWIIIALLLWLLSGTCYMWQGLIFSPYIVSCISAIISTVNSACFLMILPYIEQFPFPNFLTKEKYTKRVYFTNYPSVSYKKIVWGMAFLVMAFTLTYCAWGGEEKGIKYFDLPHAIITIILLGSILFATFWKREMPFLAWLSLIILLVTLVGQFVMDFEGINIHLKVFINHTYDLSLMMLMMALTYSEREFKKEKALKAEQNAKALSKHLIENAMWLIADIAAAEWEETLRKAKVGAYINLYELLTIAKESQKIGTLFKILSKMKENIIAIFGTQHCNIDISATQSLGSIGYHTSVAIAKIFLEMVTNCVKYSVDMEINIRFEIIGKNLVITTENTIRKMEHGERKSSNLGKGQIETTINDWGGVLNDYSKKEKDKFHWEVTIPLANLLVD